MRIILVFLLILGKSVLPSISLAETRTWLTSVDEAMKQARERDQQVLVDLYAEWCGWCKRLEEDVFSTPAFQDFASNFVLLRVDTEDGAEGTQLQERYEAYSLPTTLVLDPNSVMVAEVKGYAPAAQYIATIRQEIASFDELIRGFDRFKDSGDMRALGVLADEFHKRRDGQRAADLYRRIIAANQLDPEKSIRVRYQLTDALRLAGQYDVARLELDSARHEAVRIEDGHLVQRFDLLGAQISVDMGDCTLAEAELEEFLGTYPGSDLVRVARRTLQSLRSEGYRCT